MKYLKMFESFFGQYTEINSDDYYNSTDGNLESMSENEFFTIRDKFRNKRWSVYSYKDTKSRNTENLKEVCEMTFDKENSEYSKKLILTKVSDEWYYIYLREKTLVNNKVKLKHYKADQLEGLIKLLDDIL